jgi:hypothetical protein
MLTIILWIFALVLFVLAALGVPDAPRFRLGWAGAACATLAVLIGKGVL